MTKTRQSRWIVMVMVAAAAVVTVEAARDKVCQQMRGECRLVTWMTDGAMTRNISCYCKHGEEVSRSLVDLSHATCMNTAQGSFNTSVVHIVGCNVSSPAFPKSLLATCRGSTHLVLHVEDSPWMTLASPDPHVAHTTTTTVPDTVTATFIHSNVSGMPEGVVSGAGVQATVWVEGGQMGVIESHAFSGYPSDAQVSVTFKNTKILSVMQGAFDLPPAAQMEVRDGRILKLERHSFSGGAALNLSGVVVGNLLPSSLNIYGLKKLSVNNCTMAAVYAAALEHRAPSYIRNITGGQHVLEGSEAIFSDNKFMKGNGQAFAQLCIVARVVWRNNTVLTTSDMPLRLQGPRCGTQRDWHQVFTLTGLSCQNCSNFTNPDEQTCAMYESGYCISCEEALDGCNEPVLPYLMTKCQASHPHIAKDIKDKCVATSARTPKALQVQEKAAAASLTPLVFVVTLGVTVLLAVSG